MFVGGNVLGEVCGSRQAAVVEVAVGCGEEEDRCDKVAQLVLVLVRRNGDEAPLAVDFFYLGVGVAAVFGAGEVEADALLDEGVVGAVVLGELQGGETEAGQVGDVGAEDLVEV